MKTQPTLPGKTVTVPNGTQTITYPEKVKRYCTVSVPNMVSIPAGNMIQKSSTASVTKSNGLPAPYTKTWSVEDSSHYDYVPEVTSVQQGMKDVTKHNWVLTGNMRRGGPPCVCAHGGPFPFVPRSLGACPRIWARS
mgnify:CR=1 FL=1